jgi:hypothetical protein
VPPTFPEAITAGLFYRIMALIYRMFEAPGRGLRRNHGFWTAAGSEAPRRFWTQPAVRKAVSPLRSATAVQIFVVRAQLRNPELIPPAIKRKLKGVGLWDVNPVNLFRITWKNDVKTGLYGGVNYLEIPPAITGVKARVIGLVGKYFPTGAHKVGAAFWLPRAAPGERRVRSGEAQGGVAVHGELLPRRRV